MANDIFDSIVSPKAERESFQADWNRQRETARAFLERFEAGFDTQLLADEVGMGKTYVAMAAIAVKLLRATKNDRRALLITPPSAVLRSKWEQEIRSFSQSYLVTKSKRRTLRPLIVRNFWELVANLHDYENDGAIMRVSEDLLCCILDSVWQWGVKSDYLNNRMNRFPRLNGFDRSSVAALQFSSLYSMAAWWSYLDEYKSLQEQSIRDWITKDLRKSENDSASQFACNKIKAIFKEFASKQDSYEPNVLILGMSALQRPRTDQFETQRFSTFILGVLLSGRWEQTRKAFLKTLREANTLLPDANNEMLSRLARADLYRTRDCVGKVLEADVNLRTRWQKLEGPDPYPADVKSFFKDFMKAVVGQKLRESGIELAVIDEVHNWKDGKNGGREFKETFAAAIPHKLLLSATPFQLAEGEMRRVFDHAAMPGGKTQEVLRRIYEQERVVELCLTSNDQFQKAWDQLSDEPDSLKLLRAKIAEVAAEDISRILNDLATEPAATPALREFSRSAHAYREAVDALAEWQRQIVIRHIKPRGHRSFHSGADFGVHPAPQQTSLYVTDGMTKDSDAFINFLAMRLDQQIRIQSGVLDAANAHLMGGLTSSKAAFKNSAAILAHSKSAPDTATQSYMAMFNAALDHHEHPKVLATVEHALTNYLNGRKTLIFCERVDTLREIESLLRDRLEKALPQTDADVEATREKLLENESFVEMRLSRMLCMRQSGGNVLATDSLLTELRSQAIHFAVGCLLRTRAKVTERRVLRLLDLWMLPEIGSRYGLKSDALELFRALRSIADSDEPKHAQLIAESILHSKLHSDDLQQEGRDAILAQVNAIAEKCIGSSINIWEGDDEAKFFDVVWDLIESEAEILLRCGSEAEILLRSGEVEIEPEPEIGAGFYATLIGMQRGLRKVLLRPDLFRTYIGEAGSLSLPEAVHAGVRARRGDGESTWSRMTRFVRNLVDANGTINPDDTTNTRRRSLWRGVDLKGVRRGVLEGADSEAQASRDDRAVRVLHGKVPHDGRVVLCAAFNSPLAPDVLICTSIGSEGIDLHKECAEVIHHDLPWNPARLEQRIGRIDRVGSLAEIGKQLVRVGVPFQEQSYERFQYNVLLARAQRFEVLLGKPDFDLDALNEEVSSSEDGNVTEIVADADWTSDDPPACLPEELVQWFSVDLSLEAGRKRFAEQS